MATLGIRANKCWISLTSATGSFHWGNENLGGYCEYDH
jgi:hypothetical protein